MNLTRIFMVFQTVMIFWVLGIAVEAREEARSAIEHNQLQDISLKAVFGD